MHDTSLKYFDVVCGMECDIKVAPYHAQFHGKMYYFCTQDCYHAFVENPEKYISGEYPKE